MTHCTRFKLKSFNFISGNFQNFEGKFTNLLYPQITGLILAGRAKQIAYSFILFIPSGTTSFSCRSFTNMWFVSLALNPRPERQGFSVVPLSQTHPTWLNLPEVKASPGKHVALGAVRARIPPIRVKALYQGRVVLWLVVFFCVCVYLLADSGPLYISPDDRTGPVQDQSGFI